MWLNLPPAVRIYVATAPTDMRKSFDGLSAAVSHVLERDPFAGHLFVFFNRRRDLMKSLVWDGSGYWLMCKRLEHGRFKIFDRVGASRTAFELTSTDFALLMDGIDLRGARRRITHDEISRAS